MLHNNNNILVIMIIITWYSVPSLSLCLSVSLTLSLYLSQNDADSKISLVSREYALYCQGKFVAQSLGEHTFYGDNNMHYGKACESAKSNALMRCCKDLGIASELWDPKV